MNYLPKYTNYSAHEHNIQNRPIPSVTYGSEFRKGYDTRYNNHSSSKEKYTNTRNEKIYHLKTTELVFC